MTKPMALRLRRLASPRRPEAPGRGGRSALTLLRLGCVALLAWIGYIHLHLWQEGYRHIPTNGPLFLVERAGRVRPRRRVADLAKAACRAARRWLHRLNARRPHHQPQRGPFRLQGVDLGVIRHRNADTRVNHNARPHYLDRLGDRHPQGRQRAARTYAYRPARSNPGPSSLRLAMISGTRRADDRAPVRGIIHRSRACCVFTVTMTRPSLPGWSALPGSCLEG